MNSMLDDEIGHAGKYLKEYEVQRYTIYDRWLLPLLGWVAGRAEQPIIVSPDAEELADVSLYQAGMDWVEYHKHARAVFLKVSQNVWKDPEFETNYAEARREGLGIGGYVFFDGRKTPQEQANTVIAAMQGKYFDMELYVDWERSYSGAYEGLANVVKLMKLLEAAGIPCKAVGLYTGYYWFIEKSNASLHAAEYAYLKIKPLWLAWYASASVVRIPAPWTEWTLWQYGTPTMQWGQPTAEIDMNKSRFTRSEFTNRYLGAVTPPPDGGSMTYVKGTTIAADSAGGLKVRNAPVTGTVLGYLPFGTQVEGSLENGWIKGTFNGLNGFIAAEWVTYTVVPAPPTPNLPDLPISIVLGDDVTYIKQTVTVTLKPK